MADDEQPFRREDQERMTDGALLQPLEPGELGRGQELVAGGDLAYFLGSECGLDGAPDVAADRSPVRSPWAQLTGL